jgi:hypothetical protein
VPAKVELFCDVFFNGTVSVLIVKVPVLSIEVRGQFHAIKKAGPGACFFMDDAKN